MHVLGKEHLLHLPPPLCNGHFHHPTFAFELLPHLLLLFQDIPEQKKSKRTTRRRRRRRRRRMSTKSPIFPMLEPHHFSDYGFDPQIDFFQVLGEARRHKREASRSIDSIHFKLQKPISKDDHHHHHSRRQPLKKRKWWRNALLFIRGRWAPRSRRTAGTVTQPRDETGTPSSSCDPRDLFRASISGPVYLTESRSEVGTPYRTAMGPSSGPLAGTLTPSGKGDLGMPYLNLRELNMEQYQQQRVSASAAMPIYLVT